MTATSCPSRCRSGKLRLWFGPSRIWRSRLENFHLPHNLFSLSSFLFCLLSSSFSLVFSLQAFLSSSLLDLLFSSCSIVEVVLFHTLWRSSQVEILTQDAFNQLICSAVGVDIRRERSSRSILHEISFNSIPYSCSRSASSPGSISPGLAWPF